MGPLEKDLLLGCEVFGTCFFPLEQIEMDKDTIGSPFVAFLFENPII